MNKSFHTCAQGVQITRMANSKVNSSQCYAYDIITVYLLQNDPWVWKRLQSKQHHNAYSNRGLTTSTGDDQGRSLPSFLPLARTSLLDSIGCWLIYGNERQAWVGLWLLLSKWGKWWHEGCQQGRLDSSLTCRKWWLQPMEKAAMTPSMLRTLLLKTWHWTYHRVHYGSSI
jgi:hypothetical protein